MTNSLERKLVTALLGAALLGAPFVSGCSDDSGSDTDATAAGQESGTTMVTGLQAPETFTTTRKADEKSTTPTTAQRLVMDAKSQEEYEKSITELQEKLKSSPDDLALLAELAVAQYQTRHFRDAGKTYEKMLSIQDDAQTRNNYANVLRDAGKRTEAQEGYEKAIATDPTLAVAYVNLANLWFTDGKKDQALEVLDRGIAKTSGEDRARLQEIKKYLTEQK